MKLRRRYLLPVSVLGLTAVALPALASSGPLPVEAVDEGVYYHHWSNAQQTIALDEKVKFANPYGENERPYHGLKFTGGTAGTAPSCTGVPAAAETSKGAPDWHAECTFSKPGTYTFICTVHPSEMRGTITVTNGEPTVTTEAAASVGERAATLRGSLNPEGKPTEYFFKWGLTESYGQTTSVPPTVEGTTDVPVSAMLSGLAPGTLYHYRLVAHNERGAAEGVDRTFTTASPPPPPGPPTATTGSAAAVSETEATLQGTVNPDGRPTKYFFEWGPTSGYGQLTAEVPAGEDHSLHAASATLSGLTPGTVYHFRLVAHSTETVPGADQTFTTVSPPAPPSSPPVITSQPPVMALTPILSPPAQVPPAAPYSPGGGSPLADGPHALRLAATQHGTSVHGALGIASAGAGGRLEIALLATAASLAGAHRQASPARVGRLLRSSLHAGVLSFAVPLTARGRAALRRHQRLALTVRITLTPLSGAPTHLTREVVLRG